MGTSGRKGVSEECLSSGGSVSIYSQVGHPTKRSWEQESQPEEKVKQPSLRKKMGCFGCKAEATK